MIDYIKIRIQLKDEELAQAPNLIRKIFKLKELINLFDSDGDEIEKEILLAFLKCFFL